MTAVYKTGDRRSRISVTTTLTISYATHGAVTNWVDGSIVQDGTHCWYPDAIASASGKVIQFDFSAPTVIDEATSYQGGAYPESIAATRGVWRWQGWNGSWVNIGSSFTLGGMAVQVHDQLRSNTVAYTKYRLLGVSGAVSDWGWMQEIEFREDAPPPPGKYCDPLIVPGTLTGAPQIFNAAFPIERMTRLMAVQYTTQTPPYQHCARSRVITGCLPGDYIEAAITVEATWDFGPPVCEWAGVLMLRKPTDSGSVPDVGWGPTSEFRAMCENPGVNVLYDQHHCQLTWIGATTIMQAGDYVVDWMSYASMGELVHNGQYLTLSDGTMHVKRWRA